MTGEIHGRIIPIWFKPRKFSWEGCCAVDWKPHSTGIAHTTYRCLQSASVPWSLCNSTGAVLGHGAPKQRVHWKGREKKQESWPRFLLEGIVLFHPSPRLLSDLAECIGSKEPSAPLRKVKKAAEQFPLLTPSLYWQYISQRANGYLCLVQG